MGGDLQKVEIFWHTVEGWIINSSGALNGTPYMYIVFFTISFSHDIESRSFFANLNDTFHISNIST